MKMNLITWYPLLVEGVSPHPLEGEEWKCPALHHQYLDFTFTRLHLHLDQPMDILHGKYYLDFKNIH